MGSEVSRMSQSLLKSWYCFLQSLGRQVFSAMIFESQHNKFLNANIKCEENKISPLYNNHYELS